MHRNILVAKHNHLLPFAILALFMGSCGVAEHRAHNSINVQRENFGPDHSLYRHHDIMLDLNNKKPDMFGLVEEGPRVLDQALLSQEPEVASASKAQEQKPLARQVSLRLTPNDEASLWRTRVLEARHQKSSLIFDRAGIRPKLSATRPASIDAADQVDPPCQKPLRRRAIHRLNGSGEIERTYKAKGSVI